MNASKSIIIAALSLAIALTLFWATGLTDNRPVWASASAVATPVFTTGEKANVPGRSKDVFVRPANLRSAPAQTRVMPLSATDLQNGGFENGPDGSWTEYSYKDWPIIVPQEDTYITPHSGNWLAWLGGDDDEIAYISQTVALPAEVSMLSFWYWIDSDDACGYDFAWVKINGTNLLEFNLCSQYNTEGWIHTTVNIAAYAGTTATLEFRAETDDSQFSNYFVDDVVLLNRPSSDHITYLPLVLKNFWSGYFDDFSNPNSGWCIQDTADVKMGYFSGEFQLLLKRPNIGYMCAPDNLIVPVSSYSVEVDARMASGDSGSYSLVFGLRWGQGTRQNYVVSVEPYTQYYRIQRRNMDGSWTTLVDWTYSELINPGAQTNRLRIDRWGTNIWFSINDLFVTVVSDDAITGAGLQAGVGVNSYGSAPVDVRFDNFKASQP